MTEVNITILDDPRTIESISFSGPGFFKVGEDGVAKIVAYGEPGLYGLLPWLAVYDENGKISHRIPALQVVINYCCD